MFGIGTPPLPALPNCARTGSENDAPAFRFAGQRPLAFASAACAVGVEMKFATKSCASDSTPCVAAYFVTRKPCTPRNGTDGYAIFGSWMILNFNPLDLSVSEFHGPVIQNAACFLRNAFCAVELSTFELISPSLFHLSTSFAFFRKALLATPMSDGSRLPALLTPNT